MVSFSSQTIITSKNESFLFRGLSALQTENFTFWMFPFSSALVRGFLLNTLTFDILHE